MVEQICNIIGVQISNERVGARGCLYVRDHPILDESVEDDNLHPTAVLRDVMKSA